MKYFYSIFLIFGLSLMQGQTISLTSFATGFGQFTEITNAGDSRLFVVEKTGLIKIVNANGSVNSTPFLNLSSIITTGSERGLLGLAFHPDYSTNGIFFVNYTNSEGNTVIARYSVSANNINVANAASASILMTISQPFSNHNGGCINFGPDGYLWISMGDGGSGGDPQNHSQNKNSHLGKMLRIDVDNGTNYAIPTTNPFQNANQKAEIYYTGLRNAWKFSFDSGSNDVWIADVGQNAIEEINKVNYQTSGLNFGWKCYEGNSVYSSGSDCTVASAFTYPFVQYTHSSTFGCSVTGGYVYRGTVYSNMIGKYVFADYCRARIGIVHQDATITYSAATPGGSYTTFGQDINGELYVGSSGNGTIYKIIDTSPMSISKNVNSVFKLYPNPSNDQITIENLTNALPLQVTIINQLGQVVTNKTLLEISTNLSVNDLDKGIYFVDIEDAEGNKQVTKFLKN